MTDSTPGAEYTGYDRYGTYTPPGRGRPDPDLAAVLARHVRELRRRGASEAVLRPLEDELRRYA